MGKAVKDDYSGLWFLASTAHYSATPPIVVQYQNNGLQHASFSSETFLSVCNSLDSQDQLISSLRDQERAKYNSDILQTKVTMILTLLHTRSVQLQQKHLMHVYERLV